MARPRTVKLTNDSVIVRAPGNLSSAVGSETVMLGIATNHYYSTDAVGTLVWDLVEKPRTVSAIVDAIISQFEVEPEACERDLHAFLLELSDEGLVLIEAA